METNQQFVTAEKFDKLAKFLEKMSKRLNEIEASNNKIMEQLESGGDSDDSAWEGFGPKPEKTPVNPNAEQYTLELHHGPYTIYRHDGESDKEWQRRKDHLMDQRITFLNGSGVNGTPEQVAYLQRIEERLGRKVFQYPLATT
jgi:hypothetical protein